jgi:GWxTD domain-containing protein
VWKLLSVVLCAATLPAATANWLALVAPIITPGEKKAYLALRPEAREKFEEEFWKNKSIAPEEYYRRLQHIDSIYGSSKPASGANTDPGRIYLSLGPPNRITRIPSSRILAPLEIWYYDSVPGVLNTELRLVFFQKNSIGFLKLYSPTVDTIRALLLPQAGTNGMFGPNDGITEANLHTNLTLPPAEDEAISAAVDVATGVKYSGNDEILGRIQSPEIMLRRDLRPLVESKFIVGRPKLDFLLSRSPYGGSQVDFSLEVAARHDITVEVLQGIVTIYKNVVNLKFATATPIQYLHRLDLLPGSYRMLISVDSKLHPYTLDVPAQTGMSDIVIASEARDSVHETPYGFEGRKLYPAVDGRFAIIALAEPGEVSWTIRRNIEIVWRQKTRGETVAVLVLPSDMLEPGKYDLEAAVNGATRRTSFVSKKTPMDTPSPALVSFNANLAAAPRYAFIGHQLLLRGKMDDALRNLNEALKGAPLKEAQVDGARIDALSGRWDQARDRLRPILAADPNHFDALCVFAYVEAKLQDYEVAADYYRRALAVQDSPAVRLALSALPKHN